MMRPKPGMMQGDTRGVYSSCVSVSLVLCPTKQISAKRRVRVMRVLYRIRIRGCYIELEKKAFKPPILYTCRRLVLHKNITSRNLLSIS